MNLDTSKYFLNSSNESIDSYKYAVEQAVEIISEELSNENIFSGLEAKKLEVIAKQFIPNEEPQKIDEIIRSQLNKVLKNSLNVNSPNSMAHLHCPVMIPSLVAEVFISALNQSMDSWDQSPIATYIEQNIINWLGSKLYSDNAKADGVFTSGGTQSNLMGLLLARDFYCKTFLKHDISNEGLPNIANNFRVLCTSKTHFSIHKSLSLLGLGKNCVELVETNDNLQLDTIALSKKIYELKKQNLIPISIVTTVGDTDFGCIDNIKEIAKIANKHNIWLHADAAVGGALVLSDKYSHLINGLELVDSITIDFHKLFFQPISCGAFFCKNKSVLKLINYYADYLNPDKDGFDSINLVDKSIQTTRRFDALKLTIALKTSGIKLFSKWIDHIIDTTTSSIKTINNDESFQLAYKEKQHLANRLNTVVFRFYNKDLSQDILNTVNNKIHKAIFHSGNFAIAQTKVKQNTYLKITLVNPMISTKLIDQCLSQIKLYGNSFIKIEKVGNYD